MMKMSNDGRQLGNVSCLHVNNFSLEYSGFINETFTNHQKYTLHTEFKTQVRFVANFKISTRHDAFWLAPLDFAPPRTWYTDTKLVTWLVEVGGSLCFTKSKYLPLEDPTPLDVDHAAHVCRCIGRPKCVLVESYWNIRNNYFKMSLNCYISCRYLYMYIWKKLTKISKHQSFCCSVGLYDWEKWWCHKF